MSGAQPLFIVPAVIAALMPNAGTEQQRALFQDIVHSEGSYDAAKAYFENWLTVNNSGIVFGATRPPPNATLRSIEIDRLKVFYQPTFPPNHQQGNPYSWTFYIGRSGKGPESIMVDWSEQGIVVKIQDLIGEWADCNNLLTVLADARVRISFYDDARTRLTHELVFPPDPNEVSTIPVHYLN
ncbi:hypothetical protein C8R44DRAFT_983656 [Mycena epipterygia]|nr:hypothetical protein C8R44DRAFT_983656 [Mycena epipterygia]